MAFSIVLIKCNFLALFLLLPSFKMALDFTKWERWAICYLDQVTLSVGFCTPVGDKLSKQSPLLSESEKSSYQ